MTKELASRGISECIVYACILGGRLFYSHAFVLKRTEDDWAYLDSDKPKTLFAKATNPSDKWDRASFFKDVY